MPLHSYETVEDCELLPSVESVLLVMGHHCFLIQRGLRGCPVLSSSMTTHMCIDSIRFDSIGFDWVQMTRNPSKEKVIFFMKTSDIMCSAPRNTHDNGIAYGTAHSYEDMVIHYTDSRRALLGLLACWVLGSSRFQMVH